MVFFQAGRYYQAVIQYQRIVTWLEMECGAGKEQQQAVQALMLVAHLNLALCYLRLQEYSQAVESCNKVYLWIALYTHLNIRVAAQVATSLYHVYCLNCFGLC